APRGGAVRRVGGNTPPRPGSPSEGNPSVRPPRNLVHLRQGEGLRARPSRGRPRIWPHEPRYIPGPARSWPTVRRALRQGTGPARSIGPPGLVLLNGLAPSRPASRRSTDVSLRL